MTIRIETMANNDDDNDVESGAGGGMTRIMTIITNRGRDADIMADKYNGMLQLQPVTVETSLLPSLSNVNIAYEETLSRVLHHHRRHKECLSQAAEAHRKGVWGAAVHYSHQARQHKKRHDDAKLLAAELFMHQRLVAVSFYSAIFTTFMPCKFLDQELTAHDYSCSCCSSWSNWL